MNISQILKITRQYFWNLDFDEVEIPYLNSSLPLEPNIYSFATVWRHTQEIFYLPTSPEFALKKHLAATRRSCFAIAHCFRDLESEGPQHTKEFLMLEWYEVDKNLEDLKKSVQNYIKQFLPSQVFSEFKLPQTNFDNEPDFNQYFLNEVEPKLPTNPIFVTGYPAFLSPLAEKTQENLATSLRFELYINRIEIANGCVENRNSQQIKLAFAAENQYRLAHHLPTHPISKDFITNSAKLPPCCGVGLGLDRLQKLI